MWQMGGVGPSFGQAFHFLHQHPDDAPAEDIAYGRDRYSGEVRRLCGVMDRRLSENRHLAGVEYTVADIAAFPWVALHRWFELIWENAASATLVRRYPAETRRQRAWTCQRSTSRSVLDLFGRRRCTDFATSPKSAGIIPVSSRRHCQAGPVRAGLRGR